jgi:O-antigen/teichoic acid export membrane protein
LPLIDSTKQEVISKKFLKTSFIYTIAGMLPMASATILLPFYISFLSTSNFGQLAVYFTFSLFIQIFTTYSFDASLYIHYHEFKNDKPKLAAFISSAFVLMIIIGIAATLISLVSGDFLFENFLDQKLEFIPYGAMAAVTGVFQALFKVNSNLLQSRGEPEVYLWSNLILFLMIAAFTIGGLYLFPGTLIGPIAGRMIASVLCGLWAVSKIFTEFGLHFDLKLLRSTFSFNFYSFIYQLLQWVINYMHPFVMLWFLTLSDVGVYDLAFKCMLVIEFVLNGLHNSFYPKVVSAVMAQENKGSTPEVNRYYHGFTAVIMLLICFSILFIPYAIEIVVSLGKNVQYLEAIQYLPYVGLIYIFRTIRLFFAAPYSILKYTKPLPLMYVVISLVKIGLMFLLVSKFQIFGVIIAAIVSSALEVVLLFITARERFSYKFNAFKILVAPLSIVLMVAILEPLHLFSQQVFIHLVYIVFCVGLLWWVYRNEIKLINPIKTFR